MLAKENRVTRPGDFRKAMRAGRRIGGAHAVIHVIGSPGSNEPLRFGFVVAKKVGGSVSRNRLRRRLRAVSHEFLDTTSFGGDIVIRALPGCADVEWSALREEIHVGLRRATQP